MTVYRDLDTAITDIRRRLGLTVVVGESPMIVRCLMCADLGEPGPALLIANDAIGRVDFQCQTRGDRHVAPHTSAEFFDRAGVTDELRRYTPITLSPVAPEGRGHRANGAVPRPAAPTSGAPSGDRQVFQRPATPAPTRSEPPPWVAPLGLDLVANRPAFPIDSLPIWLGAYVHQVSIECQTPVDLAAWYGLAVVATAAQRKFRVQGAGGHVEPVNIFTMVVLGPGNRKSAIVERMVGPIYDWQAAAEAGIAAEITQATDRHAELETTARTIQSKLGRETDRVAREGLRREMADVRAQQREVAIPPWPDVVVDDITPETLSAVLAAHDERTAILASEGTILRNMAGRYGSGNAPNLEIFLKAHAGDRHASHREQGRRREILRAPALTMALAPQPGVLRDIGQIPQFRDQGLLGRFLYALPVSLLGRRDPSPPVADWGIREDYRRAVLALLDLPWRRFTPPGAPPDVLVNGAQMLTLDRDAAARIVAVAAAIEPRLGPLGDLADVVDWAAKLAGAILRVAGLLHIAGSVWPHLMDADDRAPAVTVDPTITLDTVERAVAIGAYLIPHAIAAYDHIAARPDEQLQQARRAWRVIVAAKWVEFTRREFAQRAKSARFPDAEACGAALAELARRGYLRFTRDGGREILLVNPLAQHETGGADADDETPTTKRRVTKPGNEPEPKGETNDPIEPQPDPEPIPAGATGAE